MSRELVCKIEDWGWGGYRTIQFTTVISNSVRTCWLMLYIRKCRLIYFQYSYNNWLNLTSNFNSNNRDKKIYYYFETNNSSFFNTFYNKSSYPPISWGKCWTCLIKLADSKRLFQKNREVGYYVLFAYHIVRVGDNILNRLIFITSLGLFALNYLAQ